MACNLTTIQNAACISGIAREQSQIKLLQLIAQLTCEAAEGGGGGGSQTPWSENIDGGGFDLTNVNNINVTTINGVAPGAGITQLYTGAFADPNGNVTPDNLTIANSYYEDIVPPLNVWYWSVANQNWNQHSG